MLVSVEIVVYPEGDGPLVEPKANDPREPVVTGGEFIPVVGPLITRIAGLGPRRRDIAKYAILPYQPVCDGR